MPNFRAWFSTHVVTASVVKEMWILKVINQGRMLSKDEWPIFARESSCFQRVLAIAILSIRPSVTWVDQSKTVQARYQIFTVGCLEDSSFRNRKALS